MALRLIALDSGTTGDNCPAMLVDDTSGDLSFLGQQGEALPGDRVDGVLVKSGEALVTLPARMRGRLLAALLRLEEEEEGGRTPDGAAG